MDGRHSGLMVISVLNSRSSGLGLSHGQGVDIVLCSWARYFTLTVSLSTAVYIVYSCIMCTGKFNAGGNHAIG